MHATIYARASIYTRAPIIIHGCANNYIQARPYIIYTRANNYIRARLYMIDTRAHIMILTCPPTY